MDSSDWIMEVVLDQLGDLNEKFDNLCEEMADIERRLKRFQAPSEDKLALEKAVEVMHGRIDEMALLLNIRRKDRVQETQDDEQNEKKQVFEEPEIIVPTPNELPDVVIKTHLFYSERSLILMQSQVYEDNLYQCPSFVWKIENVEETLEGKTFKCTSEVFPLNGYRVGAQAQLEGRHGSVQLSLCLKNLKNYSKPFNMKLFPRVTYIVKDRCSKEGAHDVIKSYAKLFKSSLECEVWDFTKSLVRVSTFADPPFTLDDGAQVEIHVEPQSLAHHLFSTDGTLMDRVEGYRKRVRAAQERLVEWELSPYFYTGPKGYRVQAWIKLRYQLEVHVRFVQGEFDAQLTHEFPHKTQVVLFNHNDPDGHVVKSRTSMTVGGKHEDVFKFGAHKHVEKLMMNDTLFYKVTIVPL